MCKELGWGRDGNDRGTIRDAFARSRGTRRECLLVALLQYFDESTLLTFSYKLQIGNFLLGK